MLSCRKGTGVTYQCIFFVALEIRKTVQKLIWNILYLKSTVPSGIQTVLKVAFALNSLSLGIQQEGSYKNNLELARKECR